MLSEYSPKHFLFLRKSVKTNPLGIARGHMWLDVSGDGDNRSVCRSLPSQQNHNLHGPHPPPVPPSVFSTSCSASSKNWILAASRFFHIAASHILFLICSLSSESSEPNLTFQFKEAFTIPAPVSPFTYLVISIFLTELLPKTIKIFLEYQQFLHV